MSKLGQNLVQNQALAAIYLHQGVCVCSVVMAVELQCGGHGAGRLMTGTTIERERESEIDTIGYIERDALVMKARHLLQCCKSENMICCKCLSVIFYIFLAFPSGAVKGLDAHAARGGDSLPLRRQTHPVWTIMNTLS